SSRRRHTRWPRDWSSDVCSSDLVLPAAHQDVDALTNFGISPNHWIHLSVARSLGQIGGELIEGGSPSWPRSLFCRSFRRAWHRRSEERRVGKGCEQGWRQAQ